MPFTPGTVLGPYEIESLVGAGGMGEVYRARDTRLGRTVAVKVLSAELAVDPEFQARFEREARTLSHIEHPHICALYDVGRHGDTAFLVMQYLEGETLAQRLSRGPLGVAESLRIALDICAALDTAHTHGVVHRDLKPGNVMLTRTGARLLDFGLAKPKAIAPLQSDTTVQQPVTGRGAVLGTVHYMAPEQLRGHEADARSDIFSLGVVIYEMLAGTRPFEGDDTASLTAAILEHPAPPLTSPLIPVRLDRAIQVAVEKDPERRWQTCRDFGRELSWIAEERSGPVALPVAARQTRRRWLMGGIAAALFAVGLPLWLNSGADATGASSVAVLMDSAHPRRVYDDLTRRAGGTNADDLTDQLRDLPLRLLKETTGASWHREDQILAQNPDLVIVHRSCFYDATLLDDLPLNEKYFAQLYPPAADKLEVFLGYIALGNPRTRFIVYSRGSWDSDAAKQAWVADTERRFPRIKGRLTAYRVPIDRQTFRNPQTAAELKQLVVNATAAIRTP